MPIELPLILQTPLLAGFQKFFLELRRRAVARATSAGASANYSTTGTYANGSPWWCDPAYNATPCYTYVGNPGYVMFRRLDADITLTADSTTVTTGSTVTFTLTASPRYVEGQEMRITADAVSWIIDADSG